VSKTLLHDAPIPVTVVKHAEPADSAEVAESEVEADTEA